MKLISVVISGGAGTRLWPASRQTYPKPFLSLGGSPLLQQAIERGQACGADESLIVTNQDYLFLTREVIAKLQHRDLWRGTLDHPQWRRGIPRLRQPQQRRHQDLFGQR